MKAKLASCLFAAILCVPVAAYTADKDMSSKKETIKENVDDAMITTKIKADYAKDKAVSAMKIHVDTDRGVVKLTGMAKSKAEKDKAESIAKGVKGVVSVKNDIEVGSKK